jgi:NAD(P)H-nitrite reductase large subunit
MSQKNHCSCHNLTIENFQTACTNGAGSVKDCFKYLKCKPQCAECIPLVKAILQKEAEERKQSAYRTDPGID